ncbi:MAG: hypothetical protein JXN60_07090, partial [Lentisphaerae bacterium]|nr:hypothetical protein [Lentisphaerota bacterium]
MLFLKKGGNCLSDAVKSFKCVWLNAAFYALFIFFSCLYIPPLSVIVALLTPVMTHRAHMRFLRRLMRFYGEVIIYVLPWPLLKVRYVNEGSDDTKCPKLFICNHRSSSDPFLMACFPEECVQVVNVWPFRIPVLGAVAKWAQYLSVNEMDISVFYEKA